MLEPKITILILTDFYLPGIKAGGIPRSLVNLVDCLGNSYHFKMITRDRDLGDHEQYENIKPDHWQQQGNVEVFYASPGNTRPFALRKIINNTEHDILYFSSFFSSRFTVGPILLRKLGLLKKRPTIASVHGEFDPGALRIKPFKKYLYLQFVSIFGIYNDYLWLATSDTEVAKIKDIFGDNSKIYSVRELTSSSIIKELSPHYPTKTNGQLSVIFLSRISPKKNVVGALDILAGAKGNISFNIFGPIEDPHYWKLCLEKIDRLPNNISVEYRGQVGADEVISMFNRHHLFFMPTHGENFGYVILESLMAGCPVLLSDTTPWRGLNDRGVGWDLPLDRPDRFLDALHQMVDMDNEQFQQMATRAREYGMQYVNDKSRLGPYHELFNAALNLFKAMKHEK